MLRIAACAPLAPAGGVKVTLITQVLPGVTAAPLVQVVPLAIAKSAELVPETEGAAVMFRLALPVFFTVTVCAVAVVVTSWPVNVSDDGVTVTVGAAAEPVPVRLMVCGLFAALSVIVNVADRAPVAPGVNVMLMTQLEVGATGLVVVQVVPLAMANSVLPVDGATEKIRFPVPPFVTVTLCAALVVPTG
jgi:hypothetical protein